MKRVLVTGASGFIGRHTVGMLLERGMEVHAVGRSKAPAHLATEVTWHVCDLLDSHATEKLMESVKPDRLLHMAWYAEHGAFWEAVDNFAWVRASMVLLQAFAKAGGQRAVAAGSCAEYDWQYGFCSEGVTPLNPHTTYGTCKDALRKVLERQCKTAGIDFAWGRVFHLYGPHEAPDRFVPAVIRALLAGQVAPCSHGAQVRDFLHVRDVASAFVALLTSDVNGPVNIASGQPVTLRQVAMTAHEIAGGQGSIEFGAVKAPEGDPPLLVADVRRLSGEVGWMPTLDLHTGLEHTVAWWHKATL
jgi:nucleoside-diphosphate-sugar epimerase